MKKKLIAAGAASLAVAAMPVVGVFAADGTLFYTDTITATIDSACTLSRTTGEGSYSFGAVTSAAAATVSGTTFGISCNDTGGWTLTAVGAGEATGDVTKMKSSTNKTTDDIATGTSFGSASSSWAFQLSNASNATIADGFSAYTSVPSSATPVASGSATTAGSVDTGYKIGVIATQAAATYTGKVTYTLVHPTPTS